MGVEPTEHRLSTRPTGFEDRGQHRPCNTRQGGCSTAGGSLLSAYGSTRKWRVPVVDGAGAVPASGGRMSYSNEQSGSCRLVRLAAPRLC